MPFIGTGGRAAGRPRGRLGALLAAVAVAVAAGVAAAGVASPAATGTGTPGTPYVYVANSGSNTVTAYDAAAGTVSATIPVGSDPIAVAVSPDGSTAYIVNMGSDDVSVISTASNIVTATVPVGARPFGVAVSPDGRTAYVTDFLSDDVSVIGTATGTVTATIPTGTATEPAGVAVSPDGSTIYVANTGKGGVGVISTATEAVTATIRVGAAPFAVAATEVRLAAPAVTGISPASGPQAGGTSVTITGTGLTGATTVYFGTVAATGFTVNSATQITATAPAAASAGTVNVTVTTQGGTSPAGTASQYAYLPVPHRADVSASLSCPAAIIASHEVTCTLAVANAGPDAAVGVTASILLPSKLTAASCAAGCTWDGSTATWTLPALASGATARFAVTARAGAPGRVTVLAEATDPTPDPDPYNNVATDRITITRH